jgi:hypothetical protein
LKRTAVTIREEIGFWRRFIGWWEARYGTPAPKRMYDALAYAEQRARDEVHWPEGQSSLH